jgi:hypothetical protein
LDAKTRVTQAVALSTIGIVVIAWASDMEPLRGEVFSPREPGAFSFLLCDGFRRRVVAMRGNAAGVSVCD